MKNEVLAIVNGSEIKNSDLDKIIERYPAEKRMYFETEQGRNSLLEQKIAFKLMSRYAEEKGLNKNKEVLETIQEITEQILTQSAINELFSNIEITEGELLEIYKNNKENFSEEESVSAKHILLKDQELLLEIRNKILNGELSFEDAAKEYSECPSKEKGGSLGTFKKGMMVKEFEDAAFSLPLNEVSDIIKTQFGFHLIKVEEKNEKCFKNFDDVKFNIAEQLKNEKQNKIYKEKLEELKNKYDVKIF